MKRLDQSEKSLPSYGYYSSFDYPRRARNVCILYVHTHRNTHVHSYLGKDYRDICIYVCVCVCVCARVCMYIYMNIDKCSKKKEKKKQIKHQNPKNWYRCQQKTLGSEAVNNLPDRVLYTCENEEEKKKKKREILEETNKTERVKERNEIAM